jgi:hypothetical protein
MNHKINIFEELNTIKSMFNYQPGKVISEQDNTTNRQYLKEDAIKDFEAKIPQETKYKFNKMDNGWQAAGTNVQKIVDALNSFTATEYTLYNNYLALKKPEGVTGLTGIINKEMEYDNLEDVKKVADALKRLGLTGTYEIDDKDKYGQKKTPTFRVNSFKIVKSVTPVVAKTAAELDATWATTYKCVTLQPGATTGKMNDGSTKYFVGDVTYFNNGRKLLPGQTSTVPYTCDEFKSKAPVVDRKKDRVKSNTNVKNLAPLTQDIQTSIGSNPSGKLSSQELDSILQRLGGNDASSETSQEVQTTQTFPTDANGKPDLDKILASLAQ